MSEHARQKRGTSPITKATVVSEKGAAIRVERIELSDAMRANLTSSVKSIGSPKPHNSENGGPKK